MKNIREGEVNKTKRRMIYNNLKYKTSKYGVELFKKRLLEDKDKIIFGEPVSDVFEIIDEVLNEKE